VTKRIFIGFGSFQQIVVTALRFDGARGLDAAAAIFFSSSDVCIWMGVCGELMDGVSARRAGDSSSAHCGRRFGRSSGVHTPVWGIGLVARDADVPLAGGR
jgi:hypothetical protein